MLNLKHGGAICREDIPGASVVQDVAQAAATPAKKEGTPFDYLFKNLKTKPGAHLPGEPVWVVGALDALGAAMIDSAPAGQTDPNVEVNSTIPAVYTYWGQFIDHDLTANTDRDNSVGDITNPALKPISPDKVSQKLFNLRRPALDLDSVYGDGPSFVNPQSSDAKLYDGIRLRVGRNHEQGIQGERIPPVADLSRDLPRIGELIQANVITLADLPESLRTDPNRDTRAFIADTRNDENLIVAQFHLAVMRFHNKVCDQIDAQPQAFGLGPHATEKARFNAARKLTRFHYQWLVANDYLKTLTVPGVADSILTSGPKFYTPLSGSKLYMPLEHSVAAFRFGHSMVRGGYDHNRNFGKRLPGQGDGNPILPFASFAQLFAFTGNGFTVDPNDPTKSIRNPFLSQGPTLPFNWVIEWDRLTNKLDADEGHFARKIDTHLVPPTLAMVNEGTGSALQNNTGTPIRFLLRHLARRNLRRAYLLSIPTGQAVAGELGVAPLTRPEMRAGNTPALDAALDQGGFVDNTPLWYYVLKESEVRANGNSLGEVGSQIVCETIIGVLKFDPSSYLNAGWDPSQGVRLPNGKSIFTIRDFLAFTGVPA